MAGYAIIYGQKNTLDFGLVTELLLLEDILLQY